MSKEYDDYIYEHRRNVRHAFEWLQYVIGTDGGLDPQALITADANIANHDRSKVTDAEYDAYDAYFYGKRTPEVEEEFNKAWLHHIHANPHHWQHWVLIEDDEPDGYICIEMPKEYLYEMIADWWSFSWKGGNLYEIFDWWEKHKNMRLHPKTRAEVIRILTLIRAKLNERGENDDDKSEWST